jgi:hypothetical protein
MDSPLDDDVEAHLQNLLDRIEGECLDAALRRKTSLGAG